jgi:hypothetical protein
MSTIRIEVKVEAGSDLQLALSERAGGTGTVTPIRRLLESLLDADIELIVDEWRADQAGRKVA